MAEGETCLPVEGGSTGARATAAASVVSVLARTAAHRPEHPAIVFGERRIGYGELWYRARQYAAALRDCEIRPGDMVVLMLPNVPEFAVVYYAVLALGGVAVPVNALSRAHDVDWVLRDSGAKALVCAGSLLGEGGEAARSARVPLLVVRDSLGLPQAGRGEPCLDEAADRVAPLRAAVPRNPDDIALVLYTSGTTGAPKGAMLTHRNVLGNIGTTARSPFAFGPDDVLLGCLPLSHSFGQICGMGVCFLAGGTLVLMPRFDGPGALDLLVTHRCTVMMGVPTMYLALLDAAAEDPRRPCLNRVYSGGSSLPVAVLERFEHVFACPVYEGYGLTETSPCVSYNQPGMPTKPGSVGFAVAGARVGIARADLEDRIELLPAGERGEITVSGPGVMAGYLNRPDTTAEVLVDGWFRTGDIGFMNADGRLTLVDRKKDMVLRGGYNISPRGVEEVLLHHPAVAQAAVVAVPDERHGEEVCAILRTVPGVEPTARLAEEITAWSKSRLPRYKYPRLVAFTDAFPLGPGGKVLKRQLITAYLSAARTGPPVRLPASG